MKVLHVISSLARGGRERQLATIYKHEDLNLYSTKILVFNQIKDNYINEYDIKNHDIFYLNSNKTLTRLKEITKIFREYNPDIIYAWGGFEFSFCFPASLFVKGKLINGSIRHGKVLFNSKQVWRLFLLHLSRYIVANSRAGLKANFLSRGYVLYNGVDEKFIKQINTKKNKGSVKLSGTNNDELIIVSVANLVPYKDYQTIINALHRAKEKGRKFHYFILGDGPMKTIIMSQINDLGLTEEIEIIGRTSDVVGYLQSSDIFIHSSKGEGCSNAILEAMASGLPIIASDTGGTKEITGNRNGRLFEYQDVDQLTQALDELLSDADLRKNYGNASLENINQDYTITKMMSAYHQILNEILN